MKIDILQGPPVDIFKNRRKYIIIFIALLTLSCCGLFLGVYAIFAQTSHYEKLETLALFFFVGPSPFVAYFGGKLQEYKILTPPQREELAAWRKRYPEVQKYFDLAAKAHRQPILAEYEACQAWVEKVDRQSE